MSFGHGYYIPAAYKVLIFTNIAKAWALPSFYISYSLSTVLSLSIWKTSIQGITLTVSTLNFNLPTMLLDFSFEIELLGQKMI